MMDGGKSMPVIGFSIRLLGKASVASVATLCCFALQGSPIHEAACTGDLAQLRQLLRVTPAAANDKQDDGSTPLHEAARCGQKAAIHLLLSNGADATCKTKLGLTSADVARAHGHQELAALLQKYCMQADAQPPAGQVQRAGSTTSAKPMSNSALRPAGANSPVPAWSGSETSAPAPSTQRRHSPRLSPATSPSGAAVLPRFRSQFPPRSGNRGEVVNTSDSTLKFGVFCDPDGSEFLRGVVATIPAESSINVQVPNGTFEVYYINESEPRYRFRMRQPLTIRNANWQLTIGAINGNRDVVIDN